MPVTRYGGGATTYDAALDRYRHLFALNRCILLPPFHGLLDKCGGVVTLTVAIGTFIVSSVSEALNFCSFFHKLIVFLTQV